MLAGADVKYSSSIASTLHELVGEAVGLSLTATGEDSPMLAFAEMCVCTTLDALCFVDVLKVLSWCLPEKHGAHGPRAGQSRHRLLTEGCCMSGQQQL